MKCNYSPVIMYVCLAVLVSHCLSMFAKSQNNIQTNLKFEHDVVINRNRWDSFDSQHCLINVKKYHKSNIKSCNKGLEHDINSKRFMLVNIGMKDFFCLK